MESCTLCTVLYSVHYKSYTLYRTLCAQYCTASRDFQAQFFKSHLTTGIKDFLQIVTYSQRLSTFLDCGGVFIL